MLKFFLCPDFSKVAILFFLCCFFAAGTEAGQRHIRYTRILGKNYVYLRDVAGYYGMKLTVGRKTCELRSSYSKIIFTYEKREGSLNDIKVHYLYAPVLDGQEPFISEHDFLSLIDPVLRPQSLAKHGVRIIMIDSGHGARDTGAIGRIYKEKDLTLQISRKLRDILKSKGYYVVMTRESDNTLSLIQRVNKCAQMRADLFLSVHCNSAPNKTVSGMETYCLTPDGAPSTANAESVSTREPGNAFDKNNIRFAYDIHKAVLRYTGAVDRGVRHSRFFVLKNVQCPAVLIETGFMSNSGEEKSLAQSMYQSQIANGIAEGIIRYHENLSRR